MRSYLIIVGLAASPIAVWIALMQVIA